MSHVMVQNKGELPLWGMRLMGLSNKNEDQIGQFGTGLKESIALLTRSGRELIIYSGTCRIDFSIQEVDGQQEISFKLSETRGQFLADIWHGMGIHPNFGAKDWTDDWMVFREIVCNALDESGTEMLHHDIVSTDPEGVEGATRVYIKTDPGILRAYSSIEDKLMALGDHVHAFTTNIGSAIEKRAKDPVQIYHKGVWVQEGKNNSLFDYEVKGIKLNESRSADWWGIDHQCVRLFCKFQLPQAVAVLGAMLDEPANFEDTYEYTLMIHHNLNSYASMDNTAWRDAWYEVADPKAIPCTKDAHYHNKLIHRGYRPVTVPDRMCLALAILGVPTYSTTLRQDDMEFASTRDVQQVGEIKQFKRVWGMFVSIGLAQEGGEPPVKIFTERENSNESTRGMVRDGAILINQKVLGSDEELDVFIEEVAHFISGCPDETRGFQNFLVDTIAKAAFKKETA